MRHFGIGLLLVFVNVFASNAQDLETFDIITFSPPSGWRKEIKDNVIAYSIMDQKAGTWALIDIYRGIESTGNPRDDFAREWKYLMTSRFDGIPLPDPESSAKESWTVLTGTSRFLWQGKESNATLRAFTGHGYVVCVSVLSNTQQFNKQIDLVISSLSLSRP